MKSSRISVQANNNNFLPPGNTLTITFQLPSGNAIIVCSVVLRRDDSCQTTNCCSFYLSFWSETSVRIQRPVRSVCQSFRRRTGVAAAAAAAWNHRAGATTLKLIPFFFPLSSDYLLMAYRNARHVQFSLPTPTTKKL